MEAEKNYLTWTNRLLDAYRARVKKQRGYWAYVQVTERQKRGHPHSHILSTFEPGDLVEGCVEKWENIGGTLKPYWKDALRSEWLQMAVVRAGLGDQYDISKVRTEAAASRYVAKYMFKHSAFSSTWPQGWKRVRYSQSFPKLPENKTNSFVLLKMVDWHKLGSLANLVICHDDETYEYAQYALYSHVTRVSKRKKSDS